MTDADQTVTAEPTESNQSDRSPKGHTWLISPRDPLIVRDGRPFTSDPGARARSLPFPMPGSIAGMVRTLAGSNAEGEFTHFGQLEQLLNLQIRGPLLSEQDRGYLFPAPADAVNYAAAIYRLHPQATGTDECTDLDDLGLQPLFPIAADGQPAPTIKPSPLPRYWYWHHFKRWLHSDGISLKNLGHDGPTPEIRTHVKINSTTQTAEDGFLFQTAGLEFQHSAQRLAQTRSLGLGVNVRSDPGFKGQTGFDGEVVAIGGERRLSRWSKGRIFPELPETLKKSIAKNKQCRLILLTPALLTRGFLPQGQTEWRKLSHSGVKATIKAVACGRYQVVSGWNFAKKKAKPTRRLTPTGSVYFLQLQGDEAAIQTWAENIWLTNISDEAQDCNDGYGLAVLGTWPREDAK